MIQFSTGILRALFSLWNRCLNMVRLSQKEDINLMERGFLWKYLLLVVLYKNELEESVMKELVSAASNLVQKCIQVMSENPNEQQIQKISRTFLFTALTMTTICGTASSIVQEIATYCSLSCIVSFCLLSSSESRALSQSYSPVSGYSIIVVSFWTACICVCFIIKFRSLCYTRFHSPKQLRTKCFFQVEWACYWWYLPVSQAIPLCLESSLFCSHLFPSFLFLVSSSGALYA